MVNIYLKQAMNDLDIPYTWETAVLFVQAARDKRLENGFGQCAVSSGELKERYEGLCC